MREAVHTFASEAGWRLRTLLRTRRYYDVSTMIRLYKAHILSYVEGATPALFHAAPAVMRPLDAIQEHFLEQLGIDDETALTKYGLAPLSMRRDIAMLGLLFKISCKLAPSPLQELFKAYGQSSLVAHGFKAPVVFHGKALHDPVEAGHPIIIKRSIFGLIRVFNRLPASAVETRSPKQFQRWLQQSAKSAVVQRRQNWQRMFSAG